MGASKGAVLPYRSDTDELARWVEARARGRSVEQIRALGFSAKSFEGTVSTGHALGLIHVPGEDLTAKGRRFALAPPEEKRRVLQESVLEFEPYALLLEAVLTRELPAATELDWIETWWAAQGYGTSESNRAEASTVLARFLDTIGVGSYIQGRRGHPTRIEWRRDAAQRLWGGEGPPGMLRVGPEADAPPVATSVLAADEEESETAPEPSEFVSAGAETSTVTVDFGAGRVAHFTVPSVLTETEKKRLLSLLDLLISVGPELTNG